MGVTSRKYASVIFVCSIAFLMIAPLQVIDVHAAVPDQPAGGSVAAYTDNSVQLNWAMPNSTSGVSDFLFQKSTDNVTFTAVASPVNVDLTYNFTGLEADTTYYFQVRALGGDGLSEWSTSLSQKTRAGGNQSFSDQSFDAGQEFGDGSTFANEQSFTGGAMEFGSGQTFGTGTEFADNQSFTGGTHTFGSGQVFGDGTEFAPGQGFTATQTFGTGATFGTGTTFGAAQTFGANTDFSGGTHTFSAAQSFKTGATFGADQTFGAGQ